jgi:hypothetical protein
LNKWKNIGKICIGIAVSLILLMFLSLFVAGITSPRYPSYAYYVVNVGDNEFVTHFDGPYDMGFWGFVAPFEIASAVFLLAGLGALSAGGSQKPDFEAPIADEDEDNWIDSAVDWLDNTAP